MSRSAAPLGSLRSPRRAAERKSGHFTCYENRTFYLLPTRGLREVPQPPTLPSTRRFMNKPYVDAPL